MNSITPISLVPTLPTFSPILARIVAARSDPDPDARERAARYGAQPSPAVIAEAKSALPAVLAALAPPARNDLIAWAEPINAAVRNPQGRQDFLIRVSTWAVTLGDVPALAFTAETQREAMRQFQFWPSAADIFGLLAEDSARLKRVAWTMRDLAAMQPATTTEPPREGPTDEAKAAVSAMVAGLKAELADPPRPPMDISPTARQFSPETLAALYDSQELADPRRLAGIGAEG